MEFIPHTNEELKNLNIKEGEVYSVKYLNRDYFNAEEKIELVKAKAILNDKGDYTFIVSDDYGMDKYIKNVRVIA